MYSIPLIQTKLHRPVQATDPVRRPRLTGWLDQRREKPLTLVSAPAGYGKSTLVSEWIGSLNCPSAWVSLDQYDNDLDVFLCYFIAAIQSIFPEKLSETNALLRAPELPPMRYIFSSLVNELNEIGGEYVLVLDDYYLIDLQTIHDLLTELILQGPKGMHLVLCTRIDPPIPLVKLRAKSLVAEIRGQDLCFTEDEGFLLVQNILGTQADRTETDALVAKSEGWVTGIRLAILALRNRRGHGVAGIKLTATNRDVMAYLASEILENQAAAFSEGLVKTSILERFRAELFEAIYAPDFDTQAEETVGKSSSKGWKPPTCSLYN